MLTCTLACLRVALRSPSVGLEMARVLNIHVGGLQSCVMPALGRALCTGMIQQAGDISA